MARWLGAPPLPDCRLVSMETAPSAADAARARRLRVMKTQATGLLGVMAAVYAAARLAGGGAGGWGYVEAAAEAAMVGGLADWFAVTALFRHPLGLPVPHTAIIPTRKNQLGASLGEFVQANFLDADVLAARVASAQVGRRVGGWLARPEQAAILARQGAAMLGAVAEFVDEDDLAAGLGAAAIGAARDTPVAPLLARLAEAAIEGGHHQALFDGGLRGVAALLEEQRPQLRRRVQDESPWWVPDFVDDKVFVRLYEGAQRFLADVAADPDHELRRAFDRRARDLAERLRADPVLAQRAEAVKEELLAHPEFEAWLGELAAALKRSLVASAADPGSELRRRLEGAVARFGRAVGADPTLADRVDGWAIGAARYLAAHAREEAAELIGATVAGWDADDTSRRIELAVGRDLQFIRINGTVVGGLAGLAIHALTDLGVFG
ncbi:MAG: DUF445 domain-containing protein [Acidimicrobiales bacterium]